MFAVRDQHRVERTLDKALKACNPDNAMLGTSSIIESAYTELVAQILGKAPFDWLEWYMWEADFGRSDRHNYFVDGVEYNPKEQSFVQFWNIVNS
jgi:hypothetical protein